MALVDNAWYVNYGDGSTTGYYALTKWATGTVTAAGAIRRQNAAPAVGSERVFVCIIAGTTHATTEPTWVITRGGKTTDNTVTWQECTGIAALNGDATNTPSWTITATPPGGVKGTAVTLGQVIKRDSGASYQICSTAGTAGSGAEPAFSNTAGTTTADNTATWTSLGVVGNFTGWQAPHARQANAFTATWGVAGNSFFVGDNHAETQASAMTLASPGTTASPCYIYCVNRSGSLPPVSADLLTTGSLSTTGNFGITISGTFYYTGLIFNTGSGANATTINTTGSGGFKNSQLKQVSTSATTSAFSFSGTQIELVNTTLTFGNTGSRLNVAGIFNWRNTASAIAGATIPTQLFVNANSNRSTLVGVDLSGLGSGTIFTGNGTLSLITLINCKLNASAVIGAITGLGTTSDVISSDSTGAIYRQERHRLQGDLTQETTIVRTGGATDGTTPISWKIVDTASSNWIVPFESMPITIWNDSTSAITTLTIYGTTTGGGVPNNDDIWVEVVYFGSGSTPLGSFITTTKADGLAASATTNNSADGSTWGGSGAGNGFKIVVPSFTPGLAGPINITVKAAKVSATYYIDPRPSISGIRVNKSLILAPGVYANELGSGISRARAASGF